MPWQKDPAIQRFKHPTRCSQKLEYNRFRVPIHFQTNRFTFEEVLGLLNPMHWFNVRVYNHSCGKQQAS